MKTLRPMVEPIVKELKPVLLAAIVPYVIDKLSRLVRRPEEDVIHVTPVKRDKCTDATV